MKDFHKKNSERRGENKDQAKKTSVNEELEAIRRELRGRKSTKFNSSKKDFSNEKPYKKDFSKENGAKKPWEKKDSKVGPKDSQGERKEKNSRFSKERDQNKNSELRDKRANFNKIEGKPAFDKKDRYNKNSSFDNNKERGPSDNKFAKKGPSEKRDFTSRSEKKPDFKKRYSDKPDKSFDSKKRESLSDDKRGNRFEGKKGERYSAESKHQFKKKEDENTHRSTSYGDRRKRLTDPKNSGNQTRVIKSEEGKKDFSEKKEVKKNDGLTRLNKYISNSGICSRRDADTLILDSKIKVNNQIVTELGYKVKPGDEVKYNNQILQPEKMVYVLLNKPKDFITTTEDPENRKTIMDLVENACDERIYPVGRLDRNTTGLIMLTNDGSLADKLAHPSNNIKKIYQVDLNRPLTEAHFEEVKNGIMLEDGLATVDDIQILSPDKSILGLEIHIGRNRIVRRIFEHLGYEVVRLDRVMYAGLTKKDLPRGNWRFLTDKEIINLKHLQK
jgi:23S rRNA pseudouridine2605 synthase